MAAPRRPSCRPKPLTLKRQDMRGGNFGKVTLKASNHVIRESHGRSNIVNKLLTVRRQGWPRSHLYRSAVQYFKFWTKSYSCKIGHFRVVKNGNTHVFISKRRE